MDTQQQLLEVKRKILDSLVPLVISQDGDSAERAETVLSLIQLGNSSVDLYSSAYDIINSVEDKAIKTDLFMRLLGSVQVSLSDQLPIEAPAVVTPAESAFSEASQSDNQQG
jgi:hypothetical protein